MSVESFSFRDLFSAVLGFRICVLDVVSLRGLSITGMVSTCRLRLDYESCFFRLDMLIASLLVFPDKWQFEEEEEEEMPGIYQGLYERPRS